MHERHIARQALGVRVGEGLGHVVRHEMDYAHAPSRQIVTVTALLVLAWNGPEPRYCVVNV